MSDYDVWCRGYELLFPNRHKYTAYLAECPDYKPQPGLGSKRIYGDEPAEVTALKAVRRERVPEEGRTLAERLLEDANGDDPIANAAGVFRRAEEDPSLKAKVENVEVRVDALLDTRLKGIARSLKELEEWKEKARTALRRQDAAINRHEELLKRHEAICKTAYWAVQRLRETGALPEARSAGQAAVDGAMRTAGAYAQADGADY